MKFLLDSDIDEIVERIDSKNELQGKTILMTGARGFLGRYFVHVIKKVNSNFEYNSLDNEHFLTVSEIRKINKKNF